MDIAAILAMVAKGMTIIEALITAGESAIPAVTAVRNLVSGAQQGTVTDDQLNATEAQLDKLVDEFNLDIEG